MSNFLAKATPASNRADPGCDDPASGSGSAPRWPRKAARRAARRPAKRVPVAPDEEAAERPLSVVSMELPPELKRRSVTFLSADVHFEGVIRSECNVHVAGVVKGRIEVPGHGIVIYPGGQVNADLAAERIVVEGEVVGNVIAESRVENHATGSILGDVRTERLIMEHGAQLNGALCMKPSTSEAPEPVRIAGSK